jgi:hypothetical protein
MAAPMSSHDDEIRDAFMRGEIENHKAVPEPDDQGTDEQVDQLEAVDVAAQFTMDVERAAWRLRVREAAQVKVAAENTAAGAELPDLTRLDEFLAQPDPDVTYRVHGLWPAGGRVVLTAQFKAGKSTVVGNLGRALVDAQPFLDRFTVTPAARVVLIDDELDPRMLRRWLRDQNIANTAAVTVVPLRGRLSSFNILDPATRTRWAKHIGAADVLILDCLRPALDALALSEDKDAGRFLKALDELTAEAGIGDTMLVHHMGHQGERSRGDSRIQDWLDAVWRLVKDPDDDDTGRRVYLTAHGRDVDQPEALLAFNPADRHLTVVGSRKDRKVDDAIPFVLDALADADGPLTGRAIEAIGEKAGAGRNATRAALKNAIEDGRVLVTDGPRNANLHTLNPSVRHCATSAPPVDRRTEIECASAPLKAHGALTHTERSAPANQPAHSPDPTSPSSPDLAPGEPLALWGEGAQPDDTPTTTNPQPEPDDTPTHCKMCRKPLYLLKPGRDTCDACRPHLLNSNGTQPAHQAGHTSREPTG